MKKLSIKEKAKAYDEVVNKLKGFIMQGVDPLITRADVQDFFPELAESEDEKIRKAIYSALTYLERELSWDALGSVDILDAYAWLEKQGMTNVAQTYSHDYIEIGGVKWATMNVGAEKITDSGLYFAWGETQGYTAAQISSEKAFRWRNYKYGKYNYNKPNSAMTKYNRTDTKTVLDSEDDAVTAAWGGNWRMPTIVEFQALVNATTSKWTTIDGVDGRLFTDKTDSSKTLFFPATGNGEGDDVWGVGRCGCYWSRSLYTGGVDYAWYVYFGSGGVYPNDYNDRYRGFSVRGVFGE